MHSDGFGFVRDGRLAVAAGVGYADGRNRNDLLGVIDRIRTPVAGSYQCAYADFTVSGTVTAGDYVGIAFFQEQYTYAVVSGDTLAASSAIWLRRSTRHSALLAATPTGSTIRVFYTAGQPRFEQHRGSERQSIRDVYVFDWHGNMGCAVEDVRQRNIADAMAGDARFQFAARDTDAGSVGDTRHDSDQSAFAKCDGPTRRICRRARMHEANSQVVVSDWTVTGTNRIYSVAGPGSRRIEDDALEVSYSGAWTEERGNYSGGTIHHTTQLGSSITCSYVATYSHTLYIGLRYAGTAVATGAMVSITVDGAAATTVNTLISQEDVLFRFPVGTYAAGPHSVVLAQSGPDGNDFYFDFVELAVPSTTLPTVPAEPPSNARVGLGHGSFAGAGSGANRVDDRFTRLYGPSESLCRCVMVLRAGRRGKCIRDRHGDVHRDAGVQLDSDRDDRTRRRDGR